MQITNLNPGNFTTDNVYIDQIPQLPAVTSNVQTGLVGISGTANWGIPNTPVAFQNASVDGYLAFGNGTGLAKSLILAALVMMPECSQFLGTRVTDTTDVAATIVTPDASAGIVFTLTARSTGSLPNPTAPTLANPGLTAATCQVNIQSGTASVSPVLQVVISFPGFAQEVYSNIVAYATLGSAYAATTAKPNILAAINGTAPNTSASPNWVASAGSSTLIPVLTAIAATSGTDGASGVTTAELLGSISGAVLTGAYAMDGMLQGAQVVLADLTDTTIYAGLATFQAVEGCVGHFAFPTATTTATATASRITSNLTSAQTALSMDWDYFYDAVTGTTRLVNPSYKTAAVIASQSAYMYPGNKPANGVIGISATERTSNQVRVAEAGVRQQNGILYLTNNPNVFLSGNGYGLPHGMAADGKTALSDTRMLLMISADLIGVLGPLVGQMQSAAQNDPIRTTFNDRLDAYFQTLLTPSAGTLLPQQIGAYQVIANATNNTSITVAQGKLVAQVSVTTLAPVKYIVTLLQVGVNVQIQTVTATN